MDAQLVIEKGSSRAQTIPLKSEKIVVGRQQGCDVRIPSGKVSRRHCRLTVQDGILRVEDLGSANGTFINGERVGAVEVIRPGDRLEVGPITFLVKYQLSQAAIDHLLQMDEPTESIPELDVEEVTESEIPAGGSKKKPDDSDTARFSITDAEEPKKEKKEENEESEAVEVEEIFDNQGASWHPPSGEDMRDLLSRLDDG